MNAPTQDHPLTPDGAEMQLLAEATKNSNGLMVLAIHDLPGMMRQMALDRLILAEHLRLIDVKMVNYGLDRATRQPVSGPGKVFRITPEGRQRLSMLRVSAK